MRGISAFTTIYCVGENPTLKYGGLAQLGEHLLCKQRVSGSIPLISTIAPLCALLQIAE